MGLHDLVRLNHMMQLSCLPVDDPSYLQSWAAQNSMPWRMAACFSVLGSDAVFASLYIFHQFHSGHSTDFAVYNIRVSLRLPDTMTHQVYRTCSGNNLVPPEVFKRFVASWIPRLKKVAEL
jgi:hypothetical protein